MTIHERRVVPVTIDGTATLDVASCYVFLSITQATEQASVSKNIDHTRSESDRESEQIHLAY